MRGVRTRARRQRRGVSDREIATLATIAVTRTPPRTAGS